MSAPHLFEGYGLELEYMIVDRRTLDAKPIADRALARMAGTRTREVEHGRLGWSNELALHVIELKTLGPVSSLSGLAGPFQEEIRTLNALLADFNACLLPTAMHPWMKPQEAVLWPHGDHEIYEAYNRIFDCRGHGWVNLQSTHLNLAFHGDDEFRRLHSALRLLLPILPSLAASSPVVEGKSTGRLDTRLHHYRRNQRLIPSIAGEVIPETISTRAQYEEKILQRIYRDIAPHDPQHLLQYEWLNSRGAIARFDRSAVEIRLLDVQECPLADVAIAVLVVESLKTITAETWQPLAEQMQLPEKRLAEILSRTSTAGDEAVIDDPLYLQCFGIARPVTAGRIWQVLFGKVENDLKKGPADIEQALDHILQRGTLAGRIIKTLEEKTDGPRLRAVYKELADCLQKGGLYDTDVLNGRF